MFTTFQENATPRYHSAEKDVKNSTPRYNSAEKDVKNSTPRYHSAEKEVKYKPAQVIPLKYERSTDYKTANSTEQSKDKSRVSEKKKKVSAKKEVRR